MLIKYPPPTIISGPSARIGPHPLEVDLLLELGDRPPPTQNGDAFSS